MKVDSEIIQAEVPEAFSDLEDDSVDTVYIDPPFFTQEERNLRERFSNKEYSYSDVWPGITAYLNWLGQVLEESHRVLKQDGSIFVHCNWKASHHIRMLLDKIFGRENFRNEIIWNYRRWTNPGQFLQRTHQTIFFYAASESTEINELYEEYSEATNLDQIWQKRTNNEKGRSEYQNNGGEIEEHGKAKKGVRMHDVWEIPFLNPKAKERVGYPTQKPVELLERIILLSTEKDDVVLDPCCGSGTTCVAAELHDRNWIGIDKSSEAVNLARKRLKNPEVSRSKVTEHGRDYFRDPINDANSHLRYLLELIDANPVFRNEHLDGFLRETPSNEPAGVLLVSSEENYLKKRESFLDELKRTKTPQGVIVSETGTKQKKQKKLFENESSELFLIELSEEEVIQNDRIVEKKLEKFKLETSGESNY